MFFTDKSVCCFSFMNCCLIWCVEARAGTVFCKPLDQAHMYFSWCSNQQVDIMSVLIHYCFSDWIHLFFKMSHAALVDKKRAAVLLLLLSAVLCMKSVMQYFMHQHLKFIRTECCSSCNVEARQAFISFYREVWTLYFASSFMPLLTDLP